ncbi:gas vesicle protein GvpL [Salipaludibacillus keqinensis]|uniref:Gas vesicle protein GvpL n=1 Tax=Salipaludibacillus keqinensis TaxID=2045207 RepID=A0A323TPZ6_9BACI|nr:GvpL/GvpF family gas vesicle protein [Salipaludibacillus keqinensis]PYZ94633.1 gas vesicle protein GvpL [Salipaludibacillus keqinensis]
MAELENNDLIYVYAFLPEKEATTKNLGDIQGIDPEKHVELFTSNELTAVICRVSPEDFAEENFKRNVEDMKWLQQRAFHHHELMNTLHDTFTIIPLKFGTIFENEDRLIEMVTQYNEEMKEILSQVKGKEEWNLKIFADHKVFSEKVITDNADIEAKKQEISEMSKGKQFFARKKLDQFIEDQIQVEIEKKCSGIHDQLVKLSQNAEVKKNWDQKVTGREDAMAWNCVYLLQSGENVETFNQIIQGYQDRSDEEKEGLRFESTGPWPAYHFANFKSPVSGTSEQ